jgi:hypothetical protein
MRRLDFAVRGRVFRAPDCSAPLAAIVERAWCIAAYVN